MLPVVGPDNALYRDDDRIVEKLGADFYSTRFYTDRMIEYLQEGDAEQRDKPFFAYLAYTAPHFPIQAPDESMARFRGKYDDGYDKLFDQRLAAAKQLALIPADAKGSPRNPDGTPWDALSPEEQMIEARHMEAFAAMVSDVDYHVGRMLDYLRDTGELDNTIIVFMSDNGYEGHDLRTGFREAADWAAACCDNRLANIGKPNSYVWMGPNWSRASNAPIRYYKGFPTEGGTRVPFIISYPGLKKTGLKHERAHVLDIMPTLLDLAAIAPPSGQFKGRKVERMSGRSMVPFLDGSAECNCIHPSDEPVAEELFGKRAVRVGTMKAVNIWAPYGNDKWQLFDLSNDLAETQDLAASRPEQVRRMAEIWDKWAQENGVILPDWTTGY